MVNKKTADKEWKIGRENNRLENWRRDIELYEEAIAYTKTLIKRYEAKLKELKK